MCFCLFMSKTKNNIIFRVNKHWSGLAQLILLGSALISLDEMQLGSTENLGLAYPAGIRSANTFWYKYNETS